MSLQLRPLRIFFYLLPLIILFVALSASAEVIKGSDKETGLKFYEWRQEGISIRLVQRLPDQTRAFFQGRGFTVKAADTISRSCVFQTIFRNDGQKQMNYDLTKWRVKSKGKEQPIAVREAWDKQWKPEEVSQAAMIALRWSLLPTQQGFEPNDYNWGMTAYGLPPDSHFDLALTVNIDGNTVTGVIPAVHCPADNP